MIQFKDSVILCVFVAYAQLVTVVESQDPIVSTQYGKVEGFRYTTPNGFETEVFLGVPYAAPPVGDLRFEKSIPPTPWTTTRQAKDFGAPCLTVPKYTPANASEDCLFMNIIKPKNPSTDPKGYPVMLWIHGGGFLAGSSKDYPYNATAERIVEKGIVYASINYRQGAFGFFSTGNAKAPGNYGLWDQVQALKFIQKVIKKFGGNPDNVTPFAQSSGSIALSLLTLSPKTKNLYNRAIEMSGSSNIRLELNTNDLNASLNLADAVGCGCSTNTKNCLKTKAASEIQAGMGTFIKYLFPGDGTAFPGSFAPRADGDLIPDISYEKLVKRAAKKDILMGVNSQEWYVFALNNSFSNPNATFFPITAAQAANFSLQDFVRIVNGVFATPEIFGTRHQEAANKIVAFYLTQTHYNTSRNFYLQIYAQLASDIIYNVRSMREAKLRAAAGQDIFYYVYEYVPDSMYNAFFEGSGHSRDLPNLFGATLALSAIPTTAPSQQTFANLFINFAKTGTPTSGSLTAPKVTGSTVRSVRINTVSSIDQNLWTDRIQFWDNLAATYGYDWPENRRLF